MPVFVSKGRNLGGFDLAASTPEDIGVGDGNASFDEVGVDGGLELHHAILLGAVGDGHDVHIIELGTALAPVAVRETFVTPNLRAGLFFATDWNGPVEKGIETSNPHAGLRGFDMFQKGGKTAQQLALLEGLGDGVEFFEGHACLFGAGVPGWFTDFLWCEFSLEGHQDTPFVIGEMNDAGFEHTGKTFGFVARFDGLAANMPDAESKYALRRHEAVGIRASEGHEKTAMLVERLTGGHLQSRPEFVGLARDFSIRRADDDMTGEGILAEHEIKGGIELFGGNLPCHKGTLGEIRGQKRLADAADRSCLNHGADALQNNGQPDTAQARNFLKRLAGKPGNLVFGDGENAGVDGIVVLSRNHWKGWIIVPQQASLQGGMFFWRGVSCNQSTGRYACGLIF